MTNASSTPFKKPEDDQDTVSEIETCNPVSVEALRDYLDAVMPIIESDEGLKANLYAVALAHELDRSRKRT